MAIVTQKTDVASVIPATVLYPYNVMPDVGLFAARKALVVMSKTVPLPDILHLVELSPPFLGC